MKKLNVYFTAGIPNLEDTKKVVELIQESGADFMEIGIPYSDPVADGPVIQEAHVRALQNGMNLQTLFAQLAEIKDTVTIPKILMGYINPVMQFGFEKFCEECSKCEIYGLIIPDLPPLEFEKKYRAITHKHGLHFIFLITPETSSERIQYLDSLSSGFLYAVSSSSTTGNTQKKVNNEEYLQRIQNLKLKNPVFVGFGIKDKTDFETVTQKSDGAVIGTAFVNILLNETDWQEKGRDFIQSITN